MYTKEAEEPLVLVEDVGRCVGANVGDAEGDALGACVGRSEGAALGVFFRKKVVRVGKQGGREERGAALPAACNEQKD